MSLHGLQIGLTVQRRVHVARANRIASYPVRRPLRRQALAKLDHSRLGSVVSALFLRVQDAYAGDGAEEDYRAGGFGGDHGAGAGLRDEEGAGEIDIDEGAEEGGRVALGGEIGAEEDFWLRGIPASNSSGARGKKGGRVGVGKGGGASYSTTPAELMTMLGVPRSDVMLATTSVMAFSSRTSTL